MITSHRSVKLVAILSIAVILTWSITTLTYLRKEVIGQQQLLKRTVRNVEMNQDVAIQAVKACKSTIIKKGM